VDFCAFPALWQAGLTARITAVTGVAPRLIEDADERRALTRFLLQPNAR
jgi:hypothetical protein